MIGRIRQRRAFERLRRDGRRARSEHLWCTFLVDSAAGQPRVAFAIGRAVGPAVVRNRLRRRLRAIVHASAGAGETPPGWVLVGTRPGVLERSFEQLATEWSDVARHLRASLLADVREHSER